MKSCDRVFANRLERLPPQGTGLSVDAYNPDLMELHQALAAAGSRPDYLEVFQAPVSELARIRRVLPTASFAYHAEGVWLIDPEMQSRYPWEQQVDTMARHASAIGAGWINHECASKEFAGYAFGTYLPPLFTRAAAEMTAGHARLVQELLDKCWRKEESSDSAPLLLLELPPLSYFGFGDVAVAEFFAGLSESAPCGFVLDLGHLWTIWRYRERAHCGSLTLFIDEFLKVFPVHRIVQIHLAGLAERTATAVADRAPFWVDAHEAPVPEVLWEVLSQVLAHPGLMSLKGVALEVDSKPIPLIVQEFMRLRRVMSPGRFGMATSSFARSGGGLLAPGVSLEGPLPELYAEYVRVVSGQQAVKGSRLESLSENLDWAGLARYAAEYLPNELLCWGGDVIALFPKVWAALERRGITGKDFVRFWFEKPLASEERYDFFYIKLDRWAAFVRAVAPELADETEREATVLRCLHAELNNEPETAGVWSA